MQSDPVIWNIIGKSFCSFKVIMKPGKDKFCRNEYNVSGLCQKGACPLANSRYATVREENGVIYLYMKTIERAHSPKNLWEKVELNHKYADALGQIDEQLEHWPAMQVHRVKQRLTRLHQYLLRMKRFAKYPAVKLSHLNKKEHRRDLIREAKALDAARLDFAIKQELLERLKNKTYGDLYNLNPQVFNEVLDEQGVDDRVKFVEVDDETEKELEAESLEEDMEDLDASGLTGDSEEEDEEEGEEEEDEEEVEMEFEEDDNDPASDIRKLQNQLMKKLKEGKGKRKGAGASPGAKKQKKQAAHIEIEYETEDATTTNTPNW